VEPARDLNESEPSEAFHMLRLDALVRMKLTSFRDKDRTHLRDMISVGLVDESVANKTACRISSAAAILARHS
jgi:hypothetical protein